MQVSSTFPPIVTPAKTHSSAHSLTGTAKDAPVILLDEATASLDVENETAVQAALSGLIKDKTVLIIAHRMRTVMNADQIVLLSGGRVVEMGSPAELLKKNGLFRHMAQLQSESMEWTA